MSNFVQANARVPEEGRPILLAVAARLRDDAGFLARLKDFLGDDASASPWADRFAALEKRVWALEAEIERTELARRPTPSLHDIPEKYQPAPPPLAYRAGEQEPEAPEPEAQEDGAVEDPSETMEAWAARAAAITISTGEGRGRKLTDAGADLFKEMVRAGVRHLDIARTLGMARQSVDTRAKKVMSGI